MTENYIKMPEQEIIDRIREHKNKLRDDLTILTHHYQRQEIVDIGDHSGDSLELSRTAARAEAKFIVFCGVHFMAESAAILARPEQAVFIPDEHAGCPMADMADSVQVERAWSDVASVLGDETILPVTYVNSDAELKAFCGEHGGTTCTSSNAAKVFEWAYGQSERVFFFPDQHLGQNTADKMGIDEVIVWDPDRPMGGNSRAEIESAKLIVWKGFCHVHTHFTVEQVKARRDEFPGCLVIVHPECERAVVRTADASGSTSQIISYTENAPEGSTVVIGTESHLVLRLAELYKNNKNIVELVHSTCPNMFKISLSKLLQTLDSLDTGRDTWFNQVVVDEPIKTQAALALRRMLDIK